jgi:DEAD/DEAH box helicase domain-containing protein
MATRLEDIAYEVINYLKDRTHEEKPHIAVLGPPSSYVLRKFLESYNLIESRRRTEESYEFEEDEEEVSEETFSISNRAWYLMGAELDKVKISSKRRITRELNIIFRFAVRTAPGKVRENYANVELSITLLNENRVKINVTIDRPDKDPLTVNQEREITWNGNKSYIVIGIPIGAKIYDLFEHLEGNPMQIDLKDINPDIEGYLATRHDISFEFSVKASSSGHRLTSRDAKYVNCAVASIILNKLDRNAFSIKSMIICLAGYFDERKINDYLVERDTHVVYAFDAGGYRWALGHLLEVEGEISWKGYDVKVTWDQYGVKGASVINCLLIDDVINEEEGKLILRDWHIAREEVYRIKTSGKSVKESINELIKKCSPGYDTVSLEIICDALSHALERIGVNRLFEYQEKALMEITPQLLGVSKEKKHYAIVARTAGGKTYAFLLPIVFAAAALKTRGHRGCKAVLFYPTKALANDQADELARLLWFFNSHLLEKGRGDLAVSMGVLHGNIKSRFDRRAVSESPEITMIKCPLHKDKPLEVNYIEEDGIWIESIRCSEENCQLNTDEEKNKLLNKWIKLSREAIYSDPPDILITDEDMINVILMRNPAELTIIGYSKVKLCKKCGATYASLRKRKCHECGSEELVQIGKLGAPVAVILDEAHMLRGSFGIQTFYLLKRFEQAIREIHRMPVEWRPTYIISSATIHKPDAFAASLLGSRNVEVLKADYEERGGEGSVVQARRIFVFIMPKAYEMQATCIRALSKFYKSIHDHIPQTIIFVNTLAESNELCRALHDELGNLKVGGHTTDYEQSRVKIEQAFSKGEYKVLVATRTLEVGVDYESVDAAVIYGMPFYISDFAQRIGRAGRNRDALIFVIFDPQKPIDYYYYHNYRLLCDPKLRDEAMSLESYTIKSDNVEAIYRSIKRAVFDYLAIHVDYFGIEKLYDEDWRVSYDEDIGNKLINALEDNNGNPSKYLLDYLRNVFGHEMIKNKALEDQIRETISWLVQEIKSSSVPPNIKMLLDRAKEMFQLHNLRRADKEVEVHFPLLYHEEGRRKRELSIAVKHYMRGQITSYRGMFFTVNLIDGDTEDIEKFLESK